MRYIASVSWGKDSLAMLLRLIDDGWPLDEVVFYDTGMEFQAIYDTRDMVVPMLEKPGIKYTEIHPERLMIYDMFERPKTKRTGEQVLGDGWCGGPCRWGTFIKLRALDKQTERNITYIGIAADEPKRLAGLESHKRAPLAEWNMTEADCLAYCYERGFEWREGNVRLYDILDRVSCWCCANKNLKELRGHYHHLPQYWERLKDLQRRTDRPMKGYYDKEKTRPKGVFELEARFAAESEQTTLF